MISKALLLLPAWAVSAYRYAATPPPITADQVISDSFGGAFCGDEDGSGCTVRAPGAKAPLVTQLLRNASDVEAYAAQRRPGVRNPVLWVPLGHATTSGRPSRCDPHHKANQLTSKPRSLQLRA